MIAAELLATLTGRWRFDRVIEGEGASMTGEAVFARAADGALDYHEEGVLTLRDGRTTAAYRSYRFSDAGGAVAVHFADGPDRGRPYVDLCFAPDGPDWVAHAVHPCGPDRYDVTYRLTPPDRFATDIAVVGPHKTYRIDTRFVRVA